MPIFICRWQNGDFSAAFARNREDADVMFDEVGNPDGCEIFTAPDFMVHFALKARPDGVDDFAPFEFQSFGERFGEQIMQKAYVHYYDKVIDHDSEVEETNRVMGDLEAAIRFEKVRLWGRRVPLSKDPEIRRLQLLDGSVPVSAWKQIIEAREDLSEDIDTRPTSDDPRP